MGITVDVGICSDLLLDEINSNEQLAFGEIIEFNMLYPAV